MIIVRLKGGLGNQMFQFAFGRALSIRYSSPLLLDCSHLKKQDTGNDFTNREFELGIFGDIFKKNSSGVPYVKLSSGPELFDRLYSIMKRQIFKPVILNETDSGDTISLPVNTRSDIHIYGYWQSEEYFNNIAEQLRKDFTFPSLTAGELPVLQKIQNSDSVSIHFRRGDYLKPANQKVLGVLPLPYYLKAMEVIENKIENPVYFIFSDDIAWARDTFKSKFETYFVYGNVDSRSYIDLQLMSYCKHNIISNSSFSWWGAWLNRNLGKKIISPEQWFSDRGMNARAGKLIPREWMRL